MNTWRTTGSSRIAGCARSELSTGTSRQPSSTCPSSLIARSISYSHAMREAGSRGRNTMPTPYWPAGGSFTPCLAISSRRNRSGIWIRMPAPSESLGSQPTAPRCVRLRSTVRPCSTMVCDFLPLMLATKPTPQASCSFAGWYRPWGSGKLMAELTNIQLLRCSDNGLANARVVDPAPHRRPPERLEDHEAQFPLRRLLVAGHELHEALGSKPGAGGRHSGGLNKLAHPGHFRFADQAQPGRQLGRHDHAGGDGLAVQPGTVSRSGLDGVAEGMPEVEERPRARLALIGGDDSALELATALDPVDQRFRVALQELRQMGFQPFDEGQVEGQCVLDHFGEPCAQLALGKRIERREVGNHGARLVEGTDHVFAAWVIDRGLAADRRVDLREQRGRDLQQRHAALVDGGGKAGEVAHDPAAEGDEQRVASAARLEQGVEHAFEHLPALGLFAVAHDDLGDPRAFQALPEPGQVERRDHFVRHDGGAAPGEVGPVELRALEQPAADVNRVRALAQRYAERFHCSSSRSTRSRTRNCTLWAPVSTTRSATPR